MSEYKELNLPNAVSFSQTGPKGSALWSGSLNDEHVSFVMGMDCWEILANHILENKYAFKEENNEENYHFKVGDYVTYENSSILRVSWVTRGSDDEDMVSVVGVNSNNEVYSTSIAAKLLKRVDLPF